MFVKSDIQHFLARRTLLMLSTVELSGIHFSQTQSWGCTVEIW